MSTLPFPMSNQRCRLHGGFTYSTPAFDRDYMPECQTKAVLDEIAIRRSEQYQRYGTNEDIEWGTGPETRWLGPYTGDSARQIERCLRDDYEDYEDESGQPTWVHLIREEVAEAFTESDPNKLRNELLDVAALCVSFIEKIDAQTEKP